MIKLNLPTYDFRLKADQDKTYIWDPIRRKYLVLTPEEWVRQNFIEYLHKELGYSKGLMKQELALAFNKMDKRSDIVCFNREGEPILLVECKRPTVKITERVFEQIARYNMTLKVPFIAVTNGLTHIYCKVNHKEKGYTFIPELPRFENFISA
ncbi:MAG: type I restriction enzyme HsdR N-terminal domain-containing protein [Flavobacteriales bacterium]|nr:type I restriction enzyme HsdR N-terminal domain-containing protein [Flavobacteriales bacterium]